MTRIILLLLVTLAGPFCTLTQASTLVPPATVELSTENAPISVTAVKETTEHPSAQDAFTSQVTPEATVAVTMKETTTLAITEAPMIQTQTPEITLIDTATAQTDAAKLTEMATQAKIEPTVTEDTTTENVTMEDNGTGQLVGIVIGALIGVIVIIAIIIFVVRRMGQYSPAKKRKPQKQDSILISPLKRKARQEEKKKKSRKF